MLFLDELAEFDRSTLDALRQPLEEGVLTIARAHGHVRYPARFQLVAAMNPCRCGHHNDTEQACRCPPGDAERYVSRVSGPLLDRIDLRVEMTRVPSTVLLDHPPPEDSATVRKRIAAARWLALARNGGRPNALLSGATIQRACALDAAARATATELAGVLHLTARGVHRVLRVSRTVADLAGRSSVSADDVLAAAALHEESRLGAAARAA